MGKPCSMDLRERVIGRIEAGESCRSVSRAFEPGEATAIRWARRKRETGSFAPGQMGGHRPCLIAGRHEEWLVERIKGGDFTLVALTAQLAKRGLIPKEVIFNPFDGDKYVHSARRGAMRGIGQVPQRRRGTYLAQQSPPFCARWSSVTTLLWSI